MYEKCLTCTKMGISCDGPNFMAMGTTELIAWCNARRKQLPGMTYDRIVEATGLSKGTVSGFFNGSHSDYRIETIRPILKMLVGGEWDDNPCADPSVSERVAYEERIQQLEAAIEWRDDKIQHLSRTNDSMQTLITNTNKRNNANQEFLWEQIRWKNRVIAYLTIPLVSFVILFLITLIIDRNNPDMGYFWLADGLQLNAVFVFGCIIVLTCVVLIALQVYYKLHQKKRQKCKIQRK